MAKKQSPAEVIRIAHLHKAFGPVQAVRDLSFQVRQGELFAFLGVNGAGKSTTISILCGQLAADRGEIEICGQPVQKESALVARKLGVVFQNSVLDRPLTVRENLQSRAALYGITGKAFEARLHELAEYLDFESLLGRTLGKLSGGQRRRIDIARALLHRPRLLILDEPTSSLNDEDAKMLLDLLMEFKKQGLTSIIITHKLNEIIYCADRCTILRDGSTIETLTKGVDDLSEDRIIKGMVGRPMEDRYPKREHNVSKEVMLEVKNWTVHHPLYPEKIVDDNISFKVHKGEVVGFSGLQGAGRTELAMSIFGKSYGSAISGELYIKGEKVDLKDPRAAIQHGLAYVTEDRKTNGLILDESIRFNTTLARLSKVCDNGIINTDLEVQLAEQMTKEMGTKTPSNEQRIGNLSGGNQQKALLGKWMFTEPDILILDEPTRGIDVGAKYDIYCLINQMVEQGKSVIMISSEMPEILGMCDRVYIMNEGKMAGELDAKEATQEGIMAHIMQNQKK